MFPMFYTSRYAEEISGLDPQNEPIMSIPGGYFNFFAPISFPGGYNVDGNPSDIRMAVVMEITYRQADRTDLPALSTLALQLYGGEHTLEDLSDEYLISLANENQAFFLAENKEKTAGTPSSVGFAHCSIRTDYVEGTSGGPVGYLEGIYVRPDCRRQGIARALAAQCENWARTRGCSEFASDCELTNSDSLRFHLALGFEEANRVICFRKTLSRS
jgi:aminoglycoside 6'-N-acetyltransferase I